MLGAPLLLGLIVGCSGSTDVVAVGTTESTNGTGGNGFGDDLDIVEGCVAGRYLGFFEGDFGAGEFVYALDGTIQFELQKVLNREFLVVTNSELRGETKDGTVFSSDIESDATEGCREGYIEARMTNGSISGGALTYEGAVQGTYDVDTRTFRGSWDAQSPVGWAGAGTWFASQLE